MLGAGSRGSAPVASLKARKPNRRAERPWNVSCGPCAPPPSASCSSGSARMAGWWRSRRMRGEVSGRCVIATSGTRPTRGNWATTSFCGPPSRVRARPRCASRRAGPTPNTSARTRSCERPAEIDRLFGAMRGGVAWAPRRGRRTRRSRPTAGPRIPAPRWPPRSSSFQPKPSSGSLRSKDRPGPGAPMTRLACLVVLTLGLLSISTPGTSGARPASRAPSARAQELKRGARSALFEASAEGRRRAIRMLEEAVSREPDDPTLWHLLGEAYASARYGTRSRACFEHALSIEPRDAGSWFLSGMAWRREWLLRLDPFALDRAIAAFDSCTRLDPDHGEGWLRLSALLYERGDPDAAFAAAERSKDLV